MATKVREIYGDVSTVHLITYEYTCGGKHGCNQNFKGHNQDFMDRLPPYVLDTLPFVLTTQSGLTRDAYNTTLAIWRSSGVQVVTNHYDRNV